VLASSGGCGEVPERSGEVQGRYVFAGAIAATLELSRDGDRYVVALSGGGARDAGPGAPADCHVRAVGTRQDDTLEAIFTGLETETFSYGETRARSEGRRLRLLVRSNGVEVTRADTDGYCGVGVTFVGRYERAR
jgi:hypothetical protein